MGNTCCLGREKPPAPPAARAESEAVVLLRRRAQQPLGAKEEACGSSHGKTGQHDRPGDSAETPNKEKEMTQEAMDNAFDTKVRFFVRGLQTKGQQGGDEREWAACGDAGSLKPEMIACQKGAKASSNPPNQDNFCVAVFKNGYTFACVLDGHGKKGHIAATRAAQTIPFLLIEQGIGEEHVAEATIEKALIHAFEKADVDLSGHLESGCTAVAVLWKDYDVWTANAGDSRCVLLEDNKVVFATSDHKPSCAKEKARVEGSGGEVRVEEQVPRVYAAGQRGPGLGVTRALGDAAAKSCGIIATPQGQHLRLDKHKEAKVVLASDGIWEVVGQKDLPSLVQDADTAKLQTAAFEGWAALTGGGYRDDVTSMVFPLRC